MLEPIAEGLYAATQDLRLGPGFWFPCRMTVAVLADGGLALISPIPIDDALAVELEVLGPVTHIVAPNLYHHLFAGRAKERFPEAKLLGAPGLAEKLSKKRVRLELDGVLGEDVDAAFRGSLEPVFVEGVPSINEVVFHHARSSSLLVTDLLFHVDEPKTLLTRLVLRMVGASGRPAQSRIWRLSTKDRAALSRSVDRLIAHDVDRIVMAHGSIVERGGHEALARETAWVTGRPTAPRLPQSTPRAGEETDSSPLDA